MSAVPPLRERVPKLPALPTWQRHTGARVYVHGIHRATVRFTEDDGASVLIDGDARLTWIEWDRLTIEPAPPLRFIIARAFDTGPGRSSWGVFGNRPDDSSDYLWGHFPTHAEAVDYAAAMLREDRAGTNPIIRGAVRAMKKGASLADLRDDSQGYQVSYPGADEFQEGWDAALSRSDFDGLREEFNDALRARLASRGAR